MVNNLEDYIPTVVIKNITKHKNIDKNIVILKRKIPRDISD